MPLLVKNLLAIAGDRGDAGSMPGRGRSPGEGLGNLLQYSCLRIPWTEEPGGLQSGGRKGSDTPERLSTAQVKDSGRRVTEATQHAHRAHPS